MDEVEQERSGVMPRLLVRVPYLRQIKALIEDKPIYRLAHPCLDGHR